jgi:AcrR family transcriptional regulator
MFDYKGSHKIINMPRLPPIRRNKPQARTQATKTKILDAAQAAFAEKGFENTQLDEVAARAGCSRGAIYAHYANKEDLFLALMEHRVYTRFAAVCKQIEEQPDVSKRPDIFKRWVLDQISDLSWGTLTLEYKLYAVRRPEPESRQRLLRLYDSLFRGAAKDFVELLFGKDLSKATRITLERRLAVMGSVLGGLVLESRFQPKLLPLNHLQELAEELFAALIHA